MRGELASVGLPKLFRAIADEKRSGLLTLARPDSEGGANARIFFKEGQPYHTRLEGSGVRLGERLVSAGLLTHEDVEAAAAVQLAEGRERRLGEILVDEGHLVWDRLEGIVREQMEDIVFEVLRWEDASFTFEEDLATSEDTHLQVAVETLIMEGARRFREWHNITKLIPNSEVVPRFADEGDVIEVALAPEEWALVSRVDGESTLAELARKCGFTDLEAARALHELVAAEVLTVGTPTKRGSDAEEASLNQIFDELEAALEEAGRDRSDEGILIRMRDLEGVLFEGEPSSAQLIAVELNGAGVTDTTGDTVQAEEVAESLQVEEAGELEGETAAVAGEDVLDASGGPETLEVEDVAGIDALEAEDVAAQELISGEDILIAQETLEGEREAAAVLETEASLLDIETESEAPAEPVHASDADSNEAMPESLEVAGGSMAGLQVIDVTEGAGPGTATALPLEAPPMTEVEEDFEESESFVKALETELDDETAATRGDLETIVAEPPEVEAAASEKIDPEVVAQEATPEPEINVTSVARLLADISGPDDPGRTPPPTPLPPPPPETEEPKKKWSERKKVDPTVDVYSLIREFSSLDDED